MTAKNNVKEALVCYAIERALIDYGNSALEEVYYKLYQEHGLHFVDCFYNPDILKKVLREIFGDPYTGIVDMISTHLGEFSAHEQVHAFLRSLKQ